MKILNNHYCQLIWLLCIVFLISLYSSLQFINALPLNDDGAENLALSVGFVHSGIYGLPNGERIDDVRPSNSREPFPNWVTAQWIKLFSSLADDPKLHIQQSDKQLKLLKWPNAVFFSLTIIGVLIVVYQLLNNEVGHNIALVLGIASTWLSYVCMHPALITTLLTEFHAACLLVWFSWAWLCAWQSQRVVYALIAGLLMGLLILTKAALWYVFIVLLISVLIYLCLSKSNYHKLLTQLLLLIVVLLLVVPWMYRNNVHFGTMEIAGRGPTVLLTRAYKSQMTQEEFKGAFYAYAPASLKKIFKSITGFSQQDREKGGRLQRFTRFFASDEVCRVKGDEKCAIGYYIQANIRYQTIINEYAKQFSNDATRAKVEGEREVKRFALALISSNWVGHLKSSLVFAWRGAWPCNKVDGRWFKREQRLLQPAWQEWLPFFGLVSMLSIAVYSLRQPKIEHIVVSWIGSLTFTFYASLTHFIPRYSEMFIPMWLICLTYVLTGLLHRVYTFMVKRVSIHPAI